MVSNTKTRKHIFTRVLIIITIITIVGIGSVFVFNSMRDAGWLDSSTITSTNTSTEVSIELETPDNGESGLKTYKSTDGWTIDYPSSWNKVEQNYIQEESTGKTVVFSSESCSKEELESWIESEIKRKLEATEATNILAQTLKKEQSGNLLVYSYTINCKMDGSEHLLKNTIFYDGKKRYEFRTTIPPVTEKEYDEVINSFKIIPFTAETPLPIETITVETVKELFEAIGPNRTIQLRQGVYKLDILPDADMANPYATMQINREAQSLDGKELIIHDVENLSIIGLGENPVEILTKYQLANVLTFKNTRNITLSNIRAGHWPSQGGCYGGVVTFKDSNDISMDNCSFFGCGINGLELCNVKNALFNNSVIEDCSLHIMCISNSEGIIFRKSDFANNRGTELVNICGCRDVIFDGCNLSDNDAVTDIGVFFSIDSGFSAYVSSFERNDIISNITIKNSVIKNNDTVSPDIIRSPNESSGSITFVNTVFEGNSFDK